MSSSIYRVGLDIGYGQTKVVAEDGHYYAFPTAVATQAQTGVDLPDLVGATASGNGYLFEGNRYEVATNAAIRRSIPPRSADFLLRYAPVLACHAFQQLGRRPTDICVGLALAHYATYRAAFKRVLEHFVVDGVEYNQRVWVVPQGVGVMVDWRLNDQGEPKEDTDVTGDGLILDIGYNTIDAVGFSDGVVDAQDTRAFDHAGVSQITEQLADLLARQWNYRPSAQKAHEIFRLRRCVIRGKEISLQDQISQLTDDYFSNMILMLQDQWGPRIAEYRWLLMAGGGAYYVDKYVPHDFAGQVVYMRPRPEYSNARGFLKVLFTASQSKAQGNRLHVVG